MKRKPETTALAVIEPQATDVALPEDLIAKARDYASKSRSERTLDAYQRWFAKFVTWCDANRQSPMPASPATVAGYITWLASGQDQNKPMAVTSINVAISAVMFAHRKNGHTLDLKLPQFEEIWAGIRREIAKTRTIKKARPIMGEDLREMLELLRPEVPREARDAAILALGWSGALRRSELVALDLEKIGTKGARGFVTIDERGATITLMTSKASQETAETVVIPRDFTPISCRAIENWIRVGDIKHGSPMFRGVKGRGWSLNPQSGYTGVTWSTAQEKWQVVAIKDGKRKSLGTFADAYEAHVAYCTYMELKPSRKIDKGIAEQRLSDRDVSRIIKSRIKMLVMAREKDKGRKKLSKDDIAALVAKFSGHSMRSGYATTAASKGISIPRIKSQTRHKGDSMVMGYIREVDKYKSSGLDGVGV